MGNYCQVILTDEFRTSKICSECKVSELEHPKLKYKKKGKNNWYEQRSHTICHCTHDFHLTHKLGTHIVWNRDYNAARNILNVMKNKLLNKDLGFFSRTKKFKSSSPCSYAKIRGEQGTFILYAI